MLNARKNRGFSSSGISAARAVKCVMWGGSAGNKVTAIKHTENDQHDTAVKRRQENTKWQDAASYFIIPGTGELNLKET